MIRRAFTEKTFKSNIIVMKSFPKLLALFLIGLFLAFSFNAYACLVPIFGGMKVSQGSDCTKPGEKRSAQFCEGFKTLAVQSGPDVPSGGLSHFFPGENTASLFLAPVTSGQYFHLPARGFLLPPRDILVLISVFRI